MAGVDCGTHGASVNQRNTEYCPECQHRQNRRKSDRKHGTANALFAPQKADLGAQNSRGTFLIQ
ncbi:MAG: hypothetical protein LBQ80_02075 [Clostridium sp.]|nr:hypothetical protein [Clostridium sp.]